MKRSPLFIRRFVLQQNHLFSLILFAGLLFVTGKSYAQLFPCTSTADFTYVIPSGLCNDNPITFNSNEPGGVHTWTFVKNPATDESSRTDTIIASDVNPVITFHDDGDYTVTHEVVIDTCFYRIIKTVSISFKYNAKFAPFGGTNIVCVNAPFVFVPEDPLAFEHHWSFQDGTPSSSNLAEPPPVVFTTSGMHLVTHTVVSNTGCSDTYSITVNTVSLPDASFSATNAAANSSTTICEGVYTFIPNYTGGSHVWATAGTSVVGPSTSNTSYTVTFVPGTYKVTHTVIDNSCAFAASRTFIVVPALLCPPTPTPPLSRPAAGNGEDGIISVKYIPSEGVEVFYQAPLEGKSVIKIVELSTGRKVYDEITVAGNSSTTLSSLFLPGGLYVVQLLNNNEVIKSKKLFVVE